MVPARNRARMFAESFDAKYFTTDRPDEFFTGPVPRTAE
jgi:hypothetical protein